MDAGDLEDWMAANPRPVPFRPGRQNLSFILDAEGPTPRWHEDGETLIVHPDVPATFNRPFERVQAVFSHSQTHQRGTGTDSAVSEEHDRSENSGPNSGNLVPQVHGGALLPGGAHGNAGGSGRPPSAIRESAREALDKRLPLLAQIIDGEPIRHVVRDPQGNETEFYKSATIQEREKAFVALAKIGMSATGIRADDVEARLKATIGEIRAYLSEAQAEDLLERIAPHWR